MRNFMLLILGIITVMVCCSFFNLFGDPRSKRTKIADRISAEVIQNIGAHYGLILSGIGKEGPGEKYVGFSFDFDYPYILTKDQGRALLVACMEEILYAFNSCAEFRPYMKDYPFTGEHVDITIFVVRKDGSNVLYPNIGIFSFFLNKLIYQSNTIETLCKPIYYSEEKETYDEAIKILAEQQKNNPPNYSPFPFNNPN